MNKKTGLAIDEKINCKNGCNFLTRYILDNRAC